MPKIIPIKDLKDTTKISNLVREEEGPVYVTKNGYGEMVILSMDAYEKSAKLQDLLQSVYQAERDVEAGRVSDPFETIAELKTRYDLSAD